jgi:hypothetical protein
MIGTLCSGQPINGSTGAKMRDQVLVPTEKEIHSDTSRERTPVLHEEAVSIETVKRWYRGFKDGTFRLLIITNFFTDSALELEELTEEMGAKFSQS